MAITQEAQGVLGASNHIHQNKSGGINTFLSNHNFEKLEEIMYPAHIKEGSYLFWEGDQATKLYYVKSGCLKIKKSTEDGKELLLSLAQAGDIIGEYGGIGELYHQFSAEVVQDVNLGVVQLRDLQIILYQHGEFAVEFMNWLGLLHQKIQSKFRDLLLYGKPGALASTLIRMSNSFGVEKEKGILLDIKLTNTEIAEFIGTARESVNRMLNAWKDEGTIDIQNGKIFIRNIEALKCISHCPSYPACPKEICRL